MKKTKTLLIVFMGMLAFNLSLRNGYGKCENLSLGDGGKTKGLYLQSDGGKGYAFTSEGGSQNLLASDGPKSPQLKSVSNARDGENGGMLFFAQSNGKQNSDNSSKADKSTSPKKEGESTGSKGGNSGKSKEGKISVGKVEGVKDPQGKTPRQDGIGIKVKF